MFVCVILNENERAKYRRYVESLVNQLTNITYPFKHFILLCK